MKKIETVALIGLGAIGCYMAEGLLKALGQDNFLVVAQGDRKTRIEKDGVIINGKLRKFKTIEPSQEGITVDLVVIITKMPQLADALEDIKNLLGENTMIMSLLNGIESEQVVARRYGEHRVIYSVTRAAVTRLNNNVTYSPEISQIEFGEKNNEVLSERVRALSELFKSSDIKFKIPTDMIHAIWRKYMCNISENQSSAILGIPFGAWRDNEHANYVREAAMYEVINVAQALGINLTVDDLIKQREVLKRVNQGAKTSLLQDIEAGRKTEVEMFSGTLIRYGRELNIPTPVNELFYHMIKTLEDKNDGVFNF
jgi:2-dehydropantoate 2-reductase